MTVSASRPALRILTCAAALTLLAGCSGNVQENPPKPLTDFTPSAELDGQWSAGIGSLSRARYPITPAISSDTIYAASASGHLKAIDIDSGEVRWEQDLDARISSGLTFDSGRLYFGTRNGEVMALDGESGDVAWQSTVSSEVLAPPQLNSSLVVVQSVDGALTALDRFSGEQQWLYTSSQPALTLRGTGTPRTIEPVTFAGFANGRLGVFDNRNGQQLWDMRVAVPKGRTAVEQLVDLDGQPVLTEDGRLFVTSYNGRVMALNARNGDTLWSRDESSYLTPVRVGDHLFTVNSRSEVLALDVDTGRVIWKQDALSGRNLTAPVFIDGELAMGDYQGYVHLLDAETGEIAGRTHAGGDGISVRPLTDGNQLYVFTNDGELIDYDLKQLSGNGG
ncbi:Beta-barrel assembly machine subunit BamB [Kushneria sinocarnis]|uniref:Outer membrane protein assembly factor BamB n=1 Tax=Kushneria sinocarnis TaxID=595502 RepID=A0A420WZX9_9GAMM|nr:outer membrane protein assembly factor BamB [Kushneria sinocarnis]RKR06911.1 Beta-barrel assembly machine subunit BamB [Kushneria sinocarnis]